MKGELINMTQARKDSNPGPLEHLAGALSTELRDLRRATSLNRVHMSHACCILLGSPLFKQTGYFDLSLPKKVLLWHILT